MKTTNLQKVIIISRVLIKDDRGWFLKAINGNEDYLPSHTGEIYFTNATPGQVKGKHYHINAQEWFTLIQGSAELKLEDVETKETRSIFMTAEKPITIYIPPYVAHAIYNHSDNDFILCAYTDVLYDPTDTIPYTL
ncbi:MAG: WxcM-like domain-containing protein [Rikenellaceae bacterium]